MPCIHPNKQPPLWLPVVLVCLLALLLRWPSLEQPIDNDGGARAYHARLILAGEPLYSSHHTGHHLPGIYYTYVAAFRLFGDSPWAIKVFLLLWTIPTIYMLYRLGLLLMSRGGALLAAVFYAVMSAQVHMWGLTAETELFANLFRITAVYLLLYLLRTGEAVGDNVRARGDHLGTGEAVGHNVRARGDHHFPTASPLPAANWKFVWVGLCAAAAFLFKAIYLSPLALAGLVLLIEFWRGQQVAGAFRQMVARGLWLGLGFVAGLLPVALYFATQGLWPRLLLVFMLAQSYGAASEVLPGVLPFWAEWLLYPLLPLYGLAYNNAALLFLSLVGATVILLKRPYRQTMLLYLALWYVLCFVEAGINLEFYTHYYLLIVPPMALLAAWFLVKMYVEVKGGRYGRLAPFLLAGLLLLVFGWSGRRNFPYYYHFLQYKLGRETLAESVAQGWPGFGERLARALKLADYVKFHTAEADRIYQWSEDVQLYYLAGRRSPIDLLWPIDVAATGSRQRIFTPDTELIVIDLRREPVAPAWLQAGLAESYKLEAAFDEQEIYRRVD